ncbi:MAG TPA: hypothetical protein VMT02_07185 [Burkholderiales bacterium]|jgi:hypothetical protein|nr:hypothetical protein [Burkholderiales bacterium]
MKRTTTILAAALFSLSAGLAFAQQGPGGRGGQGGPGGPHRNFQPCSQAADPAKCEADRKKAREDLRAAREACKGNADQRGCMEQQYCSKQADPAKCQERAKQRHAQLTRRLDEHQAIAEACTGKRGAELEACYRDQRQKQRGAPAK